MQNSPVLITGASQRLGLNAALYLKQKGYDVSVTYRSQNAGLAQLKEAGVDAFHADFTTDEGIENFIRETKQRYSSLRAIIHNASSWWPEDKHDDAYRFDGMMQVHAKAPFLINKALQSLLNQKNADIIHMTDLVAQIGSDKYIAYAASKAALENLTYSFARKWAPEIKVNAIAPALLKFNEHDNEEYKTKALQKSLLGNEPGWQESNNAILYLLESDYITGRVLPLDGGRHLNFP